MNPKLVSELQRSLPGRALLLFWDVMPRLLPTLVAMPIAVAITVIVSSALPVSGSLVAWPLVGAVYALGYSTVMREAAALGLMPTIVVRSWMSLLARGALVGLLPGSCFAMLDIAAYAVAAGVPPVVSACGFVACSIALVLIAVSWPFVISALAGSSPRGNPAIRYALSMAASLPYRTLRALAVTAVCIVLAILVGPAILIVSIGPAIALHVLLVEERLPTTVSA